MRWYITEWQSFTLKKTAHWKGKNNSFVSTFGMPNSTRIRTYLVKVEFAEKFKVEFAEKLKWNLQKKNNWRLVFPKKKIKVQFYQRQNFNT